MHELLAWQSGDGGLPRQIATVSFFLLFILLCVFLLLNFHRHRHRPLRVGLAAARDACG